MENSPSKRERDLVIGDVDDTAFCSKKLCRGLGTSEIDRGLATISAVLGIDRASLHVPRVPRATTSEGDCFSSNDRSTEQLPPTKPSSSEVGAAVEAKAEGKGEMKPSSEGGRAAVEAKAEGEMKPLSTGRVETTAEWKAEKKLRHERQKANKACSFDEWIVILRSQYSTKNTRNFAEFGPHYKSATTILWECRECKCGQIHQWTAMMKDRVRKHSGCPFCAGTQQVCRCRSLATLRPELMKQWDSVKNEEIDPFNISSRSHKIVAWICVNVCPNGCVHSWSCAVNNRIKKRGCPYCSKPPQKTCRCSSFGAKHPDLLLEWDFEKNIDLDPYSFAPGSHKLIWWKCPKFNCEFKCVHSWQAQILQRVRLGSGCPYCCNFARKCCEHNSLQGKFPVLIAEEWDTKANEALGLNPKKMAPHGNIQAHWKCRKNHHWTTSVSARTAEFGTGCPYCRRPSHGERRLYEVAKEMGLKCEKKSIKAINVTTGLATTFYMDMFLLYLRACIEYDGLQHFEITYLSNDLALIINRDRSKNLACKKQGIHLLRISYLEIRSIDFWMAKFVKAIREFKPRTFTTKSGKVRTQRTVNMRSNPDLYKAQAASVFVAASPNSPAGSASASLSISSDSLSPAATTASSSSSALTPSTTSSSHTPL